MASSGLEPSRGRGPLSLGLLAPASWSVFVWVLFVALTQWLDLPFLTLIRNVGSQEYTSAVGSSLAPSAPYLLAASGAFVLVTHLLLLRKGATAPISLLGSAALVLGVVLGFWFGPSFAVVLGGSGAFVLAASDLSWLAKSGHDVNRVVSTFLLIAAGGLALLAAAGAARWIVNGFDSAQPLQGATWGPSFVGLQVVGFFASALPLLVLLFLFSWALRIVVGAVGVKLPGYSGSGSQQGSKLPFSTRRWGLIMLLIAVAIAVFVGVYAYLPSVNPTSNLVGEDVRSCYYPWLLGSSNVTSPCQRAGFSLVNQRIGYLWFLQFFSDALGSPSASLMLMPALLGALLAGSTYFLALEGTGDYFVAGLSSVFSAVSFQTVAGVDAGLLANWTGLFLAFAFFAVMLRGMRTQKLVYIVPAFLLFAAVLYVHPWTWAVALVVILAYAVVDLGESMVRRTLRSKKFELAFLGVTLALAGGADYLKSLTPTGSGLSQAIATILPSMSLGNLAQAKVNLGVTLTSYLGGATENSVWFILALIGVLSIPSIRERFGKLLFVWVLGISLGVVLISPAVGPTLQARYLYDLPLGILGAMGVASALRLAFGQGGIGSQGRLQRAVVLVTVASATCLMLSFALEYVGYLY